MRAQSLWLMPVLAVTMGIIFLALATAAHEEQSPAPEEPSGEEPVGCKIEIGTRKRQYCLMEPIVLRLKIWNVSDKNVYVREQMAWEDWQFEIVRKGDTGPSTSSEDGDAVHLTEYGRWKYGKLPSITRAGSVARIRLLPQEGRTFLVVVNQLYDMSLPGKYSIVAKRRIQPVGEPSRLVRSNSLELIVSRQIPEAEAAEVIDLSWQENLPGRGGDRQLREVAWRHVGRHVREYVQLLVDSARQDPSFELRREARRELAVLRDCLDECAPGLSG